MNALDPRSIKVPRQPRMPASTRVKGNLQCLFMVGTIDVTQMAANVGVRRRVRKEGAQGRGKATQDSTCMQSRWST